MTSVIIIGAGGLGAEVAWTLARINALKPNTWQIVGFTDDAPDKATGTYDGYPLLGSVATACAAYPTACCIVAIGSNAIRERLGHLVASRLAPAVVDPSADVAPSVTLANGVYVGPQAVVSVHAVLAEGALVNARAGVGHDCVIGAYAQVCPGATLSGFTTLGARALMGSNAATVPGITIGDDAQIGAGLPVYANVATGATLSPFGLFKS